MAGKIWNRQLPPVPERKDHVRLLAQSEWGGQDLADDMAEAGFRTTWEEHIPGDVLLITHGTGTSEVTHAYLFGLEWVLSYEWVVPMGPHTALDLIIQAGQGVFYAKPADDYSDEPRKLELIADWLTELGWEVYSYEGFG